MPRMPDMPDMPDLPREPRARPARDHTDVSLDTERRKAEDELLCRSSAIEQDEDQVRQQARARAAEILRLERADADHQLDDGLASPGDRSTMQAARSQQDAQLADAHARADVRLDGERDRRRRAIMAIFELERARTDRHLDAERVAADHALASRDDFLELVAHDARSLLTGIALNAAMLVHTATDDPAGHGTIQRADTIQRLTAHMDRLLGDLLDVASIEAGKLRCTAAPGDLAAIVREVAQLFAPIAAARQLALATAVPDQPRLARFDPQRIAQVLINLVTNALKFTEPGGRIEIRLHGDDDEAGAGAALRCSVIDTGCGVQPEQLARIFERAWKGSDHRDGLGLGLYIARSIVVAHGGRIWATSEPGQGAAFYFTVPAAPA